MKNKWRKAQYRDTGHPELADLVVIERERRSRLKRFAFVAIIQRAGHFFSTASSLAICREVRSDLRSSTSDRLT